MAQLSPSPKFRAVGADGLALVGGKLWTYVEGTSTPKATYTSFTLGAANTNPVVLNARGEADVWLDGAYKLVLTDADDVTIWTVDSIRDLTQNQTFTGATLVSSTLTAPAISNPTVTTGTFTNPTIEGSASGQFKLSATGVPYGTALHNNAGAVTGATNQYICSGTYAPTINGGTNVSGSPSASGTFRWLRVGNVVTVSGAVATSTLTSAGGAATIIYITLPIASSLTLTTQLSGTAGTTVSDTWFFVQGEPATDRAELNFAASTTSGHTYYLTFMYEVI